MSHIHFVLLFAARTTALTLISSFALAASCQCAQCQCGVKGGPLQILARPSSIEVPREDFLRGDPTESESQRDAT